MMALRSAIHHAETRQNLLAEREILISKSREIAQQCNTLVPIAKLPPEILLKIFTLNARSIPEEKNRRFREGYRPPDPSKDVRTVAQICHFWRELALGSASLWNLPIDCNSTPHLWTVELLRRSGFMPLKVSMNFFLTQLRKSTTNLRLALQHLNRLGELEVYCVDDNQVKDIVLKRLCEPTPILRSLTIYSGDYCADDDQDTYGMDSDVDSDSSVFDGMMRNNQFLPDLLHEESFHLQCLKTSGFIFRLDSPLYEYLTELSVSDVRGKIPSIAEWYEVLQKSEKLNSLTLVNAFSKVDDAKLPQVHLPRLVSLRMYGHFTPCSRLICNISSPPLRSLDVQVRGVEFGAHAFSNLLDNLVHRLTQQREIALPQFLNAVLTKSTIQLANVLPGKMADPLFRLYLGYPHSANKMFVPHLMPSLSNLVASGTLGVLTDYSGCYPSDMQQALIALMAPFTFLPDLKIKYETSSTFAMGLLKRFDANLNAPPIFPLSLLQIQDLGIQSMDWLQDPAYNGYENYLRWRKEIGAFLETLTFSFNVETSAPQNCEVLKSLCRKFSWEDHMYRRYHRRYSSELDSDDSMNVLETVF